MRWIIILHCNRQRPKDDSLITEIALFLTDSEISNTQVEMIAMQREIEKNHLLHFKAKQKTNRTAMKLKIEEEIRLHFVILGHSTELIAALLNCNLAIGLSHFPDFFVANRTNVSPRTRHLI